MKTGRAFELRTEIEKVERRHRFEDIDLLIEQLPNLDDASQPMHNDVHVDAVVVRDRFAQDIATGPQLVQNLFEPKLVGLVHDDEKHFIVRLNFAVFEANRFLERE